MNPLYNQIMNQSGMQPSMQFNNPMQRMMSFMQAMQNPAQFVKQHIPDLPSDIENNPNQILQYLQKTRGISNQQIQQLVNQFSGMR